MTTMYITLGLIAAIMLFVSRALFNYRHRNSDVEATKRLEDRIAARKERWERWHNRWGRK